MKKIIVAIFILLLILAPIAVIGYLYIDYQEKLETRLSDDQTTTRLEILQGQTTEEIANLLLEKNLIVDKTAFIYYGKVSGKSIDIKAGKFDIPKNATIPEIYDYLANPVVDEVTITIPEGLRGDEIADILEDEFSNYNENSFDKDEFLNIIYSAPNQQYKQSFPFLESAKNYEGFLFPDSYRFFPEATNKDILDKLLTTFNEKVYKETRTMTNNQFPPGFSYYDVINLSSIVEREGINQNEREQIAAILLNRLNGKLNGSRLLQADATLLYETRSWNNENLNKNIDSLYNSYKYPGLPPTPICNPSKESILSVFDSEPTHDLYYLHKNGRFLTARTYNEHILNLSR